MHKFTILQTITNDESCLIWNCLLMIIQYILGKFVLVMINTHDYKNKVFMPNCFKSFVNQFRINLKVDMHVDTSIICYKK